MPRHSFTLMQAAQGSPTLARLSDLVMESSARLQSIQPLIPAALRPAVHAGPIDGTTWCLLLDNAAAMTKIRQLLPALQAHLRTKGWEVESIRLKLRTPRTTN